MDKRAFTRKENLHLGRFLDVEHLAGWSLRYQCDCGFVCTAPGDIHDHVTRHHCPPGCGNGCCVPDSEEDGEG